ncbi:MAG: hypothetical protein IKV54_02530 [Clostridia bacterium]|nr:hypothetical protein [Clostridia bacterium]
MTLRKPVRKINLPMFLGLFLLCLTMLSTYFTGGLYAKYTVSDSSGDAGRVITFGQLTLTEEGDFVETGKMMIIPGVNIKKQATVEFSGSEAAVYLFVEVNASSGWTVNGGSFSYPGSTPAYLSFSVDTAWTPLEGNDRVYYTALEPGASFEHGIIKDGIVTVSQDITKNDMAGITDVVSVAFTAWVVQANGFSSPADAWSSLETK